MRWRILSAKILGALAAASALMVIGAPLAYADTFTINAASFADPSATVTLFASNGGDYWCWWKPDGTYGGQYYTGPSGNTITDTFGTLFSSSPAGTYHIGGFGDITCAGQSSNDYTTAYANAALYFNQVSPLTAGAFDLLAAGGGGGVTDTVGTYIASTSALISSSTGFNIDQVAEWTNADLFKTAAGAILDAVYSARWWLVAAAIIAGVVYFTRRAFSFSVNWDRTGGAYRQKNL